MLSRYRKSSLVLVLLVFQLTACLSDDNDDKKSSLVWTPCEDAAMFDCSTLNVPMDYNNPNGDKIDIALIRLKASGTDRKGALLFNPGGPGAQGVPVLPYLVETDSIPEAIQAAYDLVGFDPRGLGKSTPVDCSDEGLDDVTSYTFDASDVIAMHSEYSAFGQACFEKHGEYLQHLGSNNVVRDMDKIRDELGEEKLNFIGSSYGTRLAALYLQNYPENSGRLVLDASSYSDTPLRTLIAGQLEPMQSNLLSALSNCSDANPQCNPNALLEKLENSLSTPPMSESEATAFTLALTLIVRVAQSTEFGEFASDSLVDYIDTLDESVLEGFIQQVEAMEDSESEAPEENITTKIAVLCADEAARPDAQSLVTALNEFNQTADVFAELLIPQLGVCAGWPAALDPVEPVVTNTAPISLVIGGISDAQAPLAGSEDMASNIGGVFISSNHKGHTAVFNQESECVDNLVEAFLLDGMAPTVRFCE